MNILDRIIHNPDLPRLMMFVAIIAVPTVFMILKNRR